MGHILPVSKGVQTIRKRLDEDDCLVISGADGDQFGEMTTKLRTLPLEEWSGGNVDAEWSTNPPTDSDEERPESDPSQ